MAGYSKEDKAALSKGAMKSGTLLAEKAPEAVEPDWKSVNNGAEPGAIEAGVEAQQKANLADPSKAERLEKMVIARRKFLGKQ